MKVSKATRSHIFLFCLFYAAPVLDAATGFLVGKNIFAESFLGSPSQLLRGFLFFYGLVLIRSLYTQKLVFLVSLLFGALEILSFSLHQSFFGLVTGLVFTYKLIFILVVYLTLKAMMARSETNMVELLRFFTTSASLYAIGIIIPFLLGTGFKTYEGIGDEASTTSFGSRGFYASGNGLGFYLGIGTVLAAYLKFTLKEKVKGYQLMILALSLLLLGTKASLFFFLITILYLFWQLKAVTKLVIASIVTIALIFILPNLVALFETIFEVILFRFNASDNFLAFILSSRDEYLIDAVNQYNFDGVTGWLRIFFGSGSFLSFRNPNDQGLFFDTLEMDLFDVFFMYGLPGITAYLALIITGVTNFIRYKHGFLLIIWIFISVHSLIAGHVLFNGMSSVGLVIVLLLSEQKRYLVNMHKSISV